MTGAIVIRPARPDEHADLEALQWRASLAVPEDRDALLAHPDAVNLPPSALEEGHVRVALIDDALAGFSLIAARPDGDVDLEGLFVEPARWRRGVGRALVEAAVDQARASGAAFLRVVAGIPAEGFYRSCGFVRIGPADTRFGPALEMRQALAV